jgi:hypothetical protein
MLHSLLTGLTHHALTFPVMCPSFVVTDHYLLNIAARATRTWLFAIALAFWFVFGTFVAKLLGHAAKAVGCKLVSSRIS